MNPKDRSNTGSRTLERTIELSSALEFRWVGSIMPSDWREGAEYAPAPDLAVGDLVVIPRTGALPAPPPARSLLCAGMVSARCP